MNLGFAVLYAAFAAVAVWLLVEALMQHRAPVGWRVLALAGFLVFATGVVLRNVPVIVAGVLGFGVGQAMVTRLVKREGDGAYWALRRLERSARAPGSGRSRRRGGSPEVAPEAAPEVEFPAQHAAEPEPVPEWQPLPEWEPSAETVAEPGSGSETQWGSAEQPAPVYTMEPVPDDTDGYGVYTGLAAQQVREQFAQQHQEHHQHQQHQEPQPQYQPEYSPYAAYEPQEEYAASYAQYQEYGYYEYDPTQQQHHQQHQSYEQYPQYEVPQQPDQGHYDQYYGYYDEYGQYHAYPSQQTS